MTPVRPEVFRDLLEEANYKAKKIDFIYQGFKYGFDLGYRGPTDVVMTSNNLKFQNGIGSHLELWNKIMKEVSLKRFAGPFKVPPFTHYIQSPVGLVAKDGAKDTRLIFHLSHPRGTGKSVNANIPEQLCSIQYPDFNEAVKLCMGEGVGCHIGRSDAKAAFRNLGIMPHFWPFLMLMAKSPIDGKMYQFFDKCVSFGAGSSCAIFQQVSDAIAHLVKFRTRKNLVNYLDDYLFVALVKLVCNRQNSTVFKHL